MNYSFCHVKKHVFSDFTSIFMLPMNTFYLGFVSPFLETDIRSMLYPIERS